MNDATTPQNATKVPAAIPSIRLESPINGAAIVSDEYGNLYRVDADQGTIEKLRWS
jgi:hypothetical protein